MKEPRNLAEEFAIEELPRPHAAADVTSVLAFAAPCANIRRVPRV